MQNHFLCWVFSILLAIAPAALAQSHAQADSISSSAHGSAASESNKSIAKDDAKPISETKSNKVLPSDVRVLIDVSGSMKKTDPQNLRKPAVDLIVRLLPDKSRAGLWTFGNDVNILMPFKPVDSAWRKQAPSKANQINSVAMFTNIGKALDEVSFDKKSLSTDYKTHIILLTDGVVDIGKDAVANNKERQRIINEILPSLKSSGYTVHTIALSPDADADLLKQLSVATDGVFATAISADELMSVFLKIFDQAVPAERVPLENNGFLVDASIKEFTALIFRKPGEDKTILLSPEGKEYSGTNPVEGINWYRTGAYDLITADAPKAGQWKIKTDIAPQSRITVVSNLQLVVAPLRNNLHSNDVLAVTYSFQENEKTVTNKDFLGLIEANAIVAKHNTEENFNIPFTLPTPPADGFYHQSLNTFSGIGEYEIHIFVDGKTFKREFKHTLNVRDSLMAVEKNQLKTEDDKLSYTYKITTDDKLVDVKKMQVTLTVKSSGHENSEKALNLINGSYWEFAFSPDQNGDYAIDIHAVGEQVDGTRIDEIIHADKFTFVGKKTEQSSSSAAAQQSEEPHKAEEKPTEESNNLLLYTAIGIGNLLLIVLGFFIYKMLIGGGAKDELAEIEKTLAATGTAKPAKNEVVKKSAEKPEIDLSDEDPAHIPMNQEDDDMDKLFPLDSMDDSPKTNDK